MYTITIVRTEVVDGETGDEQKCKIYEQTLDSMDLLEVILAVNGMKPRDPREPF